MNHNSNLTGADGVNAHDPEYRARFLLRATKAEMEKFRGRTIAYEELAVYASQSSSTVFNRLQKPRHASVEALISWLERLPTEVRGSLVNQACRCFPYLNHPRLSHDAAQVSALRGLLRKSSGLSILRSDNGGLRTFVLTALGHEFEMAHGIAAVCGLDCHRPDWFVPLGRVKYCYDLSQTALKIAARDTIARLMNEEGKLIVLNAVHFIGQELYAAIPQLAKKSHVIFAEDHQLKTVPSIPTADLPANILTVSLERYEQIRVVIHGKTT